MSSPLSDGLEDAAKKGSEEAAKQISKRLDNALDQLQNEVYAQLEKVITTDMMDYYYGAYKPVRYRRTEILKDNLVRPVIHQFNNGQEKGFQFGIKWFPENMHHTKTGKDGVEVPIAKKYEKDIAQKFSEGIHPNGNPDYGTVNQGPIWIKDDSDNIGSAADIVRQWSKENLNKIFSEALSDIMKKM